MMKMLQTLNATHMKNTEVYFCIYYSKSHYTVWWSGSSLLAMTTHMATPQHLCVCVDACGLQLSERERESDLHNPSSWAQRLLPHRSTITLEKSKNKTV